MMNWQDRVIKVLVISFLASSSLLWGRFYMGVEGGYVRNSSFFEYTTKGTVAVGRNGEEYINENGGMANLVLGTEHFFGETERFGIRWGIFGGYSYALGKNSILGTTSMQVLSAGAFFDSITNVINTENFQFGIFGGFGYDFSMLRPKHEVKLGFKATPPILDKDTYITNRCDVHSLLARMGITMLFAKHHRFELIAQFPFDLSLKRANVYYSDPKGIGTIDAEYTFSFRRIQGLASYKYVF